IMALTQQHRLPAIYGHRQFVVEGALISYGPDTTDIVRRSSAYVDRILKGEKPASLPVQQPTKYELVINLKIARALALQVAPILVSRAEEVIGLRSFVHAHCCACSGLLMALLGLREMSNSSPQSGAKRTGRGYRGGDHNVERHQPSGPSPPRH